MRKRGTPACFLSWGVAPMLQVFPVPFCFCHLSASYSSHGRFSSGPRLLAILLAGAQDTISLLLARGCGSARQGWSSTRAATSSIHK
jgi:hypothetical protein